jgi:hypothetical protein
MTTKTLTNADLAKFTGSVTWYCHALATDVVFTDGAKHVADAGGAHWLLDEIALALRFDQRVATEEFQVWVLRVKEDRTAELTCDNGNGKVVYSQRIIFTDFPLAEITLFCTNKTILLPSEY